MDYTVPSTSFEAEDKGRGTLEQLTLQQPICKWLT